ncbi:MULTISPECIES: MHYT domain-containing protein [unclassified Paenibacillus]|uniref:MHYT domain-containing protein n=1 Tax=unclassified Paenibacillus TaxID=185978 RepID=UPI001AEA97CB|nr:MULTISPECIES: MHYT domain-containing protein [unclassified Paenibacillus]MBP1156911.1 PAS domain S-box-containing protein [Paenibacillus sp. PvP091]MBP1172350.1 PAS domain S-box-containing protein [Paenibacillus sp. PvR098]MBP2438731.1 PAS domain S-box-containing protein [Paenibacillus sp. PvP052]
MEHLHGTYSFPLVGLSIVISLVSSYYAITLCERVLTFNGRARALRIWRGSGVMGLGIWSMHFVGLLAFQLPVDVQYDIPFLILSMVLPVFASWAALSVILSRSVSGFHVFFGGLFMGLSITGMHYTGMAALRLPGTISFNPYWTGLSVSIAFITSFVVLYVGGGRRRGRKSSRWSKVGSAALLGTAIAGMHYAGMMAAEFKTYVSPSGSAQKSEELLLAYWIGAAALLFLMLISVIQFMDRRFALRLADSNKKRYDFIFEHNPDMVCLFDLDGRLLRTNPAAELITGYDREMFLSRPFTRFLSRRDSIKIRSCFAKVVMGTPQTVECTIRHKLGYPVHLSTTIVPMIEGEKIVDIYTISKDITEQKKTEQQLLQAKKEAEQAAKVKSEFLTVMSHEVRTPLNGVIGMSEILMDTELDEEQQEYVKIISKSGKDLLSVINDVLDFSKIESGKMSLKPEIFHLQGCLNDTLRLFIPEVRQRGLSLAFYVDPAVPEIIIGDEGRLKQVLINLIGNAVKFTEHGKIEVSIRQAYRKGEQLQLEFMIRDTGIGIHESYIADLFQPFYQLDSGARRHGGTGLGLSISKKLVELMGGTIRAESVPGQGSTFTFSIQAYCSEDKIAVQL